MSKEDSVDVRAKAAAAIATLADRSASKGREAQLGAKVKPGWVTGADGQPIHPGKIREAIAYYDIAMQICPEEPYWPYLRALQLETLGDYAEAEAAYRAVKGTYAGPGLAGAERCARRARGEGDPLEEALDAWVSGEASGSGTGDAASLIGELQAYLGGVSATVGSVPDRGDSPERGGAMDDATEDALSAFAQQFADRLIDRDYVGASAMMHASTPLTATQLRDQFEDMFQDDDDWPTTAGVMEIDDGMPDKEPDDVAWTYVALDSLEAEALTFTISRNGDGYRVRNLEFGRP
jgi:hypothetical protein